MINAFDTLGIFLASAPFPLMLLLKATLILCLAWVVTLALRNAAASMRYAVWALALAAVLALPLGMIAGPVWRIAVAAPSAIPAPIAEPAGEITSRVEASSGAFVQATSSTPNPIPARSASELSVRPSAISPAAIILFVWLLGLCIVIARMAVGRMMLTRVARRAIPLDNGAWQALLDSERLKAEVTSNVKVFASEEVSTPLTTGTRSPIILLPAEAHTWTADHRQVVLRHELLHIAGRDAAVCIVAGFACAFYWFNPLVWLAARHLRTEQERACDDSVLTLGTPAPDYATHLLEVARSARSLGMNGFVSVAMARPTQLEGRLLAVLSDAMDRAPLTKRRVIPATLAALALLTLVSAFRPVKAEAAVIVASQGNLTSPLAFPAATVIAAPERVKQAVDSIVTREIAVSSGGTIVLDLKTGAGITIKTWDQPRLRMRASLAGRDWRQTEIELEPDGRGARLTTRYRNLNGSQSSSHKIDLTVPRRFNVRVSSAGGGIVISDLEGEVTGNTGGGVIRIDRARGHARLTTGGGAVTVTNSKLSGSVSTGGGGVLLQGVEGGLTGHSGSGDVLYGEKGITYSEDRGDGVRRASDGKLLIRKAGGRVTLAEAPDGASVSTGGGAIRIGRSGGEVYASTGGGDITIGPARGSVEAGTGAGDVTITLSQKNAGPVDVKSGNGTVTLLVPDGFAANLDLESAYTNNRRSATRIESDWDLDVSETRNWDDTEGTPRRYVRARQSVGGGGERVRVRTVNGNIIIKRVR